MRKAVYLKVLFLSLILSSCNLFQSQDDLITMDEMEDKIYYTGFYVYNPNNSSWYLYQSEQDYHISTIRKETSSTTYTIFYSAMMENISKEVFSESEFEQLIIDEKFTVEDSERYEIINLTTNTIVKQNQWCVEFQCTYLDNNPANSETPLITYNEGYYVIHPLFDRSVLSVMISQRGQDEEIAFDLGEDMDLLLENTYLTERLTTPSGLPYYNIIE